MQTEVPKPSLILNTCLAILADESADRTALCLARTALSALSSAFMITNVFEITRIWLGPRLNEYRSSNLNMVLKI